MCIMGGMAIYVGYSTALWAHVENALMGGSALERCVKNQTRVNATATRGELAMARATLFNRFGINPSNTLDVVVSQSGDRHNISGCRAHSSRDERVWNEYHHVGEVYIASIELSFLQLAQKLDIAEIILLGNTLCGQYFPSSDSRGFVDLKPLSTPTKLEEFINRIPNIKGARKARRAIGYLSPDSRSPMETITQMILCLPRVIGGYGLPSSVMNYHVDFSSEAQALSGSTYCVLDMAWPNARFALEYQGVDYHKNVARDDKRLLALKHDGWIILPVCGE